MTALTGSRIADVSEGLLPRRDQSVPYGSLAKAEDGPLVLGAPGRAGADWLILMRSP